MIFLVGGGVCFLCFSGLGDDYFLFLNFYTFFYTYGGIPTFNIIIYILFCGGTPLFFCYLWMGFLWMVFFRVFFCFFKLI